MCGEGAEPENQGVRFCICPAGVCTVALVFMRCGLYCEIACGPVGLRIDVVEETVQETWGEKKVRPNQVYLVYNRASAY